MKKRFDGALLDIDLALSRSLTLSVSYLYVYMHRSRREAVNLKKELGQEAQLFS